MRHVTVVEAREPFGGSAGGLPPEIVLSKAWASRSDWRLTRPNPTAMRIAVTWRLAGKFWAGSHR